MQQCMPHMYDLEAGRSQARARERHFARPGRPGKFEPAASNTYEIIKSSQAAKTLLRGPLLKTF